MSGLRDQTARDQITGDTEVTLFVNAGAGSGKTTALVDRVTTLVLRDGIPLHAMAAVTFTDKAGAELRDRLRSRFEAARRTSTEGDQGRARVDEALEDLDAAAIGTLHAFAQRILTEHPIEAGLPPLLEVLDEVGSSVSFEDRWSGLQTELLDDDDIAPALLLGMACGLQLTNVRSLALFLGSDWDLIDDRVLVDEEPSAEPPALDSLIETATQIGARLSECTDDTDLLLAKVQQVAESAVLLGASSDLETRLGVVRALSKMTFGLGRKENWPDKDGLRQECSDLSAAAEALVAELLDRCLRALTRWTARRVLTAAQERRSEGRLEFHDLLVLARDLLRRDASVREALHLRYSRLLLDEFQDTDPIQIELAVRIAGGAEATAANWRDVDVPAGRIFVVGDPKQSIYRFRRASIATYLDAEEHLGKTVSLTTNFRSVAPVLDWVNAVFGDLIQWCHGGQPAYEPLDRHRGEPERGPAVTVLGAQAHTDLPRAAATTLREREARDVAGVVQQALNDDWQVFDEDVGGWRSARRDDIAILVPARTSLPFLEDALDAAGVPYRAEASSLVYQATEVRTLLACARAVADASDALSVVTALRSPAFGCGDDDLWRWKQAGGYFSIYSEVAADDPMADGPVGAALAYLRRLSFSARWQTPSEVMGAIVADRRLLEVAATGPRERDAWRRLRFVVDQARAWSEVSHGGLRAYLSWAAHQGQETSRVAEAVLPETDSDAVKVMTVHAAKGLEFPIVILSGMTSEPRGASGVRLLWPPSGGYAVKLGKGVQTGDFDAVQPVDEQMDGLEKRRLLYVASTRARDHLVVSLHRKQGSGANTGAKLLADAGAVTPSVEEFSAPPLAADAGDSSRRPVVAAAPEWDIWLAELTEARTRSRATSALSASGLEGTEPEIVLQSPEARAAADVIPDGEAKGPRDVELPPWSKGRYGSAIGRAVHGVLQAIELSTGWGLDEAVAAQSLAEGVTGEEELVRSLVTSALDSEVVQRAASREHWRETYVGTLRDDGVVVEGFVDLVYREDDGTLVVVDYKTDAIPAAAVAARSEYYRPQIQAYTAALREATGASVTGELLFLSPSGAMLRRHDSGPSAG